MKTVSKTNSVPFIIFLINLALLLPLFCLSSCTLQNAPAPAPVCTDIFETGTAPADGEPVFGIILESPVSELGFSPMFVQPEHRVYCTAGPDGITVTGKSEEYAPEFINYSPEGDAAIRVFKSDDGIAAQISDFYHYSFAVRAREGVILGIGVTSNKYYGSSETDFPGNDVWIFAVDPENESLIYARGIHVENYGVKIQK
ncbi:MAG: hypothetical protein J6V01_05005 [Clostridia bacterium]|nr:hypothetical protein [Clostridia bacterium]